MLKVHALLHANRWCGTNHKVAETPNFAELSSDLYVMLINCLDSDILDPYLQGRPGPFSHEGISMLQDPISTQTSNSSAGLVSIFTRFLQVCMLPSESVIQYCSRVRGRATELGCLVQPILEPLVHLLVVHGITLQFTDFSAHVATYVIDVINGFNNWDTFIC
jgi:hypothetical protein